MNTKTDTKKLVTLGMLGSAAFMVMALIHIPVLLFLSYEPKDVILSITGFLFGPAAALGVTAVVSFLEMITVSSTGWIGLVMNILSSGVYACTAAVVYKKNRSLKGAVVGLVMAIVLTTAVMLLWNYLITPLYMNVPREQVAGLLVPAFLPFNLIKGSLNAALCMLLYKPVIRGLQKTNLLPASEKGRGQRKSGVSVGVALVSALVAASCILVILVWQGKL